MIDILRQLNEIRKAQGVTHMQLGVAAGYADCTMRKWWRHEHRPTLTAFVDVANTLGYDVVLVKREEPARKAG